MSVVTICVEIAADYDGYLNQSVFEKNYQSVFKQIISFLYSHPKCKFSFSFTGMQLTQYEQNHPEAIKLLSELTGRHQVEVLGGGYYAPALPLLYPVDRSGQIEKLTSELRSSIGKRPRGISLFESIWDPSLITTIQACGMEYVQVSSSLISESKNKYCPIISSEQGKTLKIIPLYSELQPSENENASDWVKRLQKVTTKVNAKNPLVTIECSIKKAKELVASHFLEELLKIGEDDSTFELSTPQLFIKNTDTFVQSYVPAGIDWKIAQWAQKPYVKIETKEKYPVTIQDFLNTYPQNHHLYERMTYISMLMTQCHGDKVRKSAAREKLWEAQVGLAYVCSAEGIPVAARMRQAAYHLLNEAERIISECSPFKGFITSFDYNGDGLNEYVCQMDKYNAVITLNSGSVKELNVKKIGGNYADSLNRIAQFDTVEDNYERGFFVEHLLETKDKDKYVKGQPTGSGIFSQVKFCEKKFESQRNEIQLEGRGEFSAMQQPVSLRKNYIITSSGLTIQYILKNESPLALKGIFIVESNFAQTEFNFDKKSQFSTELILNGARKEIASGESYNTEKGVSALQITDIVENTSFVFEPNEESGFTCNQFSFKRPDGNEKNIEASHTFSIGFYWDVDLSANMEMEKTISLTIIPARKNKTIKEKK